MKIGTKLKLLREEKDVTQKEVSKAIGVSERVYGYYESNERFPKDEAVLSSLADYFNVSVDYLLSKTENKLPIDKIVQNMGRVNKGNERRRLPILGAIRAGLPLLAEENWQGEVEVPSDLQADFALRVIGDSMRWSGIYDNDLAILRHESTPFHGMIVAAGIEDATWDATLKFFVEENGRKLLRAANPAYEDIEITDRHRIIGYVVSIIKEPPSLQDYRRLLVSKEVEDKDWTEAIELAAGYGLDGNKIKKMIEIYASMIKQI